MAIYSNVDTSMLAAFIASIGKTWAIGVIPELIETVKPNPSIKTLEILSSFSILRRDMISFNIGNKITKRTLGDINKPNIKVASKKKNIKRYEFFWAILKLTKVNAILLISEVLERA